MSNRKNLADLQSNEWAGVIEGRKPNSDDLTFMRGKFVEKEAAVYGARQGYYSLVVKLYAPCDNGKQALEEAKQWLFPIIAAGTADGNRHGVAGVRELTDDQKAIRDAVKEELGIASAALKDKGHSNPAMVLKRFIEFCAPPKDTSAGERKRSIEAFFRDELPKMVKRYHKSEETTDVADAVNARLEVIMSDCLGYDMAAWKSSL